MNSGSPQQFPPWDRDVPKNTRFFATIGFAVFGLAFLGFGVWAVTAPISSAVVAHGRFVATGQNKIIQHLEGGIIREFLVEEGEIVEPGQPLVVLDETAAEAELRRLVLKHSRLLAMQARLHAERLGKPEITFPESLVKAKIDADVLEMMDGQASEFAARKTEQASRAAVLRKRIAAIEEEISGLQAQRASVSSQHGFIVEELKQKEHLYKMGLTPVAKLLSFKRAEAKLTGERGGITAKIGRARERIAETENRIIHLRSKLIEEVVAELRRIEGELDDVEERIKTARDVLGRLEVRAPVRGIVVKLAHYTPRGVLSAGQEILELVPLDENLLVEASISPSDIDEVRKGKTAQV